MPFATKMLILTCLFALFSGCTASTNSLTDSHKKTAPTDSVPTTIDHSDSYQVTSQSAKKAPPDLNESIRAVFIPYGNEMIPIAVFSNGDSLAIYHDGISGYLQPGGTAEVINKLTADLAVQNIYAYKANCPTPWSAFSYAEFHQLPPSDSSYDADATTIYTNVTSDFMAQTVENHFSIREQHLIAQQYKDHVFDYVKSIGHTEQVPIIIRTIWQTDMDGDGKAEMLVESTNDYHSYEDPGSYNDLPENEYLNAFSPTEFTRYYMLTLYSETLGTRDLYTDVYTSTPNEERVIIKDQDGTFPSFGLYLLDQNNYTRDLAFYGVGDTRPFCAIQPYICDINGDGIYDICTFEKGSIYPTFTIYLVDKSRLSLPFKVVLPA